MLWPIQPIVQVTAAFWRQLLRQTQRGWRLRAVESTMVTITDYCYAHWVPLKLAAIVAHVHDLLSSVQGQSVECQSEPIWQIWAGDSEGHKRRCAICFFPKAWRLQDTVCNTVSHSVCYLKWCVCVRTGSEVGLKEKDTRVFLSHAGCRVGLNLLKGQDYLIIGPSSDVWQAGSDKNG